MTGICISWAAVSLFVCSSRLFYMSVNSLLFIKLTMSVVLVAAQGGDTESQVSNNTELSKTSR